MNFKNGWDSNDKDKFKVGETYFVIYMDVTNKGNKLRHRNGVSQYQCKSSKKEWYKYKDSQGKETGFWDGYTDFTHISGKHIQSPVYLNGYGTAVCYFFNDEQDAKNAHDEYIKILAKGLTVEDRNVMYSKMFGEAPKKSSFEEDTMEWFNKLKAKDKKRVLWLKEYGDIN